MREKSTFGEDEKGISGGVYKSSRRMMCGWNNFGVNKQIQAKRNDNNVCEEREQYGATWRVLICVLLLVILTASDSSKSKTILSILCK